MKRASRLETARIFAMDALIPQRFVFHHVPKCGGTSVGRALRKRYILSQATVTPESSFRAFEAFTGRTDYEQMMIDVLDLREQMMLYHLYQDVRCISLHVRFSEAAYENFHSKYKFITMLRDPVQRFISHYHWSYGKKNAFAQIDQDFESFLDTPRAARLGANLVMYFCGLRKEDSITSDKAIGAAIQNLTKFSVIGDISDVSGFEHALKTELGVTVRIGHENKGKPASRQQLEMTNPKLRTKIEALCAPDIAVWNAARQIAK